MADGMMDFSGFAFCRHGNDEGERWHIRGPRIGGQLRLDGTVERAALCGAVATRDVTPQVRSVDDEFLDGALNGRCYVCKTCADEYRKQTK